MKLIHTLLLPFSLVLLFGAYSCADCDNDEIECKINKPFWFDYNYCCRDTYECGDDEDECIKVCEPDYLLGLDDNCYPACLK